MTRCPRCSEENPPRARFCLACGLPFARPAGVGEAEERRLVTALFVDLVGSTAQADGADPEDVRSRLVPYQERVRRELERFGGTVEKFIGDAVVAIFGAPIGNEDDPERAVRAAFAVRDAVAALNAADAWLALDVRIGVTTGEALVRLRARTAEGETMAMGDVMNTAARIQSAARPGGILVSRPTYRSTAHAVEYRELSPLTAKGKRDPIHVWEALGLRTSRQRRRSDASFVGREQELAALGRQWRRVQDTGEPVTTFVLAEPGTGKTRLLAAFADGLDAEVFWGRCLAYGEGGAYAPVAEILSAVGIDRVLVEAAEDEDALPTIAASLQAILGPGAASVPAATAEITKGELHWSIRRALELAAKEPTVLVLEDLHWADAGLVELIHFLEAGSAPLLILGSARPEVVERHPSVGEPSGRRLVIQLPPLTAAESAALVDELLGGVEDRKALAPILRAAQGNPLFLEETVHMLADEGLLSPSTPPEQLPPPPSLTSMIGARLDRLPERERHLALRAAVLGSSFWPGALARLNGDVEAGLVALAELDVVEERPTSTVVGEREFAFKHELIREVAYGRLPKGLRAELHIRSADWFETRQERDEFAEIGAYHLEQACRLAREIERSPVAPPVLEAAEALRAAAEKAERREGLQEADRFYVRALELVDDDEQPVTAAELRLRRARVLAALGRLDEAIDRFRVVAAGAASLGRSDLRGAALVGLGNALQKLGRADEARSHLLAAKSVADETGDSRLEVQTLFELAELQRDFGGEIEVAVEDLERALKLASRLGDRHLLAEGELRMGFLLGAAGRLAEAERALARSAEIGAELGSTRDESRATFLRAWMAYHLGRREEAELLALEAQEWFERTGDSYFRVQNLRSLAVYAFARGDTVEAERRLREAVLLAQPSGGWLVSGLNADLAELLAGAGRAEEAREAGAVAVASAPKGDPSARAAGSLATACVAAAAGDLETARSRGKEALEIYVELGNVLELGRARIAFARALAAVGDPGEASHQLRLAVDECGEIGAATLVGTAESALVELGRG